MDNLYEVVRIEGKGLGCRALQDIKSGTLILREKFQCVALNPDQIRTASDFKKRGHVTINLKEFTASLINAYLSMSKKDQEEFLKLFNMFRDPNSPVYNAKPSKGDSEQFLFGTHFGRFMMYYELLKSSDILQKKGIDTELALQIYGIYQTNSFSAGLAIKISRFNHSCVANAGLQYVKDRTHSEIRATSDIKAGEEITINYGYNGVAMKKLKERKQILANVFGVFNCLCELCQYEKTSTVEDKSCQQFEKLNEILKNYFNQGLFTVRSAQNGCTGFQIAIARCIAISACIQMYNLAKMKNCHKQFLLTDIIKHGHWIATEGYMTAKRKKDNDKRKYFKEECQKLSKVGHELAKIVFGNDTVGERKWRDIHQNFEKFVREYGKDLSTAYIFFA